MSEAFETVLAWLREERAYQTAKFDYDVERDKPVETWVEHFDNYIYRLPLFGLDEPKGVQAALKLAATAVALCEHLADKGKLPAPGVPSGEIRT